MPDRGKKFSKGPSMSDRDVKNFPRDVFHKMGMIEKWGTGLRRIFSRCERAGVEAPVVDVGGSTVTFAFHRRNSGELDKREVGLENQKVVLTGEKTAPEIEKVAPTGEKVAPTSDKVALIDVQTLLTSLRKDVRHNVKSVLEEISRNPNITVDGIHERTSISARAIKNAIATLRMYGVVRRIGGAFGGHWEVVT